MPGLPVPLAQLARTAVGGLVGELRDARSRGFAGSALSGYRSDAVAGRFRSPPTGVRGAAGCRLARQRGLGPESTRTSACLIHRDRTAQEWKPAGSRPGPVDGAV